VLRTSANFTLNSQSVFEEQAGSRGGITPAAGTDFDQLSATGSASTVITLSGATLQVLEISSVAKNTGAGVYRIIDATGDPSASINGMFANLPTTGSTGVDDAGQTYSIIYGSNYVDLVFAPEPGVMGSLLFLGSAAMLRNRKRSQKVSRASDRSVVSRCGTDSRETRSAG
jgi:hypothetical protein